MILRVLKIVFVLMIIALVAYWFLSGGPSAAWRTGRTYLNPVGLIGGGEATGTPMQLPWQPSELTRGPDISDYVAEADQYQLSAGEQESAPGSAGEKDAGEPSPYANDVIIVNNAASESDPAKEYLQIEVLGSREGPVALGGWAIESAVTGVRVPLPAAAPEFLQGAAAAIEAAALFPGDSAIVTSGTSPVGASFRENICTGYLARGRAFEPAISPACPYASEALAQNSANIRAYGESCFDYLSGLGACETPRSLPSSLSQSCRSFIASRISYDGCVSLYRDRAGFALPEWRLYLGSPTGLWRDSHDVIRLLDGSGRIVDTLTY